MNKVYALAAVAGIASTAAAQSLIISADDTSVFVGDTITWTVSVTGITNADHFLSGYDLDFVASNAGLGTASTFATQLSLLINPTPGTPAGADLNQASGGQSSLIDPPVTFGNVVLGTFTVVAGAEGVLSYSVTDGGFLAGTTGIRTRQGSDFGPVIFNAVPQVASDSVTIAIPTPATAALLGLGGLVATRRRR